MQTFNEAFLRTASTASPQKCGSCFLSLRDFYFRATANSRLNANSVAPSARVG